MSSQVTIDLVVHDPKRDAFVLVAVEQGPWDSACTNEQLERVQHKILDYVDVAVFGTLARSYPDSLRKPVVVRLDCYDTPRDVLEQVFFGLAERVHCSLEVQAAIANQQNITELEFEFNWRPLPSEA